MQLGVPAATGSSLWVRLAWLTGFRLVVLTIFLIGTTWGYGGGFVSGGFSSRFTLATIAAAYVLAGAYAALLRGGRALEVVAYAQLATDQLTWTAIVFITGGPASGATSLYALTCLSGAILIGTRGAITAALCGALAFFLLCAGLARGALGPPSDQVDTYPTHWNEAIYPLFVNILAIAVVTVLASYLAERLRATGGRVVALTKRAEDAERLAALGRLAAGLAHEIRNPLGAIAGSVELLRTGGSLSEEDRKLCEIVEREAARLNDLIGDLLDLSRPRAPARQLFDLCATARDVITLATKSVRAGDVAVRFEGPSGADVYADPAQMRQLMWNLVRNAVQASSAGDEVVVRIRAIDDDTFTLEITDLGRGIPEDARAQLFDAFFTTRSHGVGIGLAVVKRILDDHDLAIEVDSVEGQGTTFRVTIPRERRDPAALAQAS